MTQSAQKDSEAGEFMARALALARETAGSTSPNPAVGAVVGKDGRRGSEGCYEGPGRPRAAAGAPGRADPPWPGPWVDRPRRSAVLPSSVARSC